MTYQKYSGTVCATDLHNTKEIVVELITANYFTTTKNRFTLTQIDTTRESRLNKSDYFSMRLVLSSTLLQL